MRAEAKLSPFGERILPFQNERSINSMRGFMDTNQMLTLYEPPKHPVDVVLDTDTYNELDDQFAIAYLLNKGDRLRLKGFTVAPFYYAPKVKDIAEGVQKSKEEILKILRLMGREEYNDKIYEGGSCFLKDENTPVDSPAARFLIAQSKGYSKREPLYVIAIGAITNVASALLLDPSIADRICVVWIGGSSLGWWCNCEFNMYQDYAAVRVVMSAEVPFVQIPAQGVMTEFCTSQYELEHWIKGKNAVCDYLYENSVQIASQNTTCKAWGRVIWDVIAVAWLLNDQNRFMIGRIENRYLPAYEGNVYEKEPLPLKMFYVHQVFRDPLMDDLFETLTK